MSKPFTPVAERTRQRTDTPFALEGFGAAVSSMCAVLKQRRNTGVPANIRILG